MRTVVHHKLLKAMLKDIFFSFKDTIKTKTTNPFFGTLIVVWIIHNWELIFTFFNFENSYTLKDKIIFLKEYLEPKPFLINLLQCLIATFFVLVSTYVLLNLSRLIVNLFEKRLTPWIYKITDSKSIVLKSVFTRIENERDILSQKLENEREVKLRLQNEISQLEDRIKELIKPNTETPTKEQSKTSVNSQNQKRINTLLTDIENRDMTKFFDKLIDNINNDEYIKINNITNEINYLLKAGIIQLKEKQWNDNYSRKFLFTNFGTKVKDEFVLRNLNK